jgi:putative tRNA adenosine deaminase-associated protein
VDEDVAVVAYRDAGVWELAEVSADVCESLELLTTALHRFPSDVGVVAFVTLGNEEFVIARAAGDQVRLFLSDAAAADDWPLAADIVDELDVPVPDVEERTPAGDRNILADLGVSAADLEYLIDDDEVYADDILADIAERIGFGEELEAILG